MAHTARTARRQHVIGFEDTAYKVAMLRHEASNAADLTLDAEACALVLAGTRGAIAFKRGASSRGLATQRYWEQATRAERDIDARQYEQQAAQSEPVHGVQSSQTIEGINHPELQPTP
ncbi:MAG: hypothetical protein JWL85_543 [Candidatus Saccharibacteria bacterium]|nr:hypothetical protein [Candidatus Saccharibacteria bacterium]